MYSVSNDFKNAIKSHSITTTVRMTFQNYIREGQAVVIGDDQITDEGVHISDFCSDNGQLLGMTPSKEIEFTIINTNNYELDGQVFDLELGVLLENDTYEYVPYGQFVVMTYEDTKSNNRYKVVANDLMIKLNEVFEENEDGETPSFVLPLPITLKEFYRSLMDYFGIEIEEQTLINSNFMVRVMPNLGGMSGRAVLGQIAELFGGFAKINRNNRCEIYVLNGDQSVQETITADEMNTKLVLNEKYGVVNVVTIGLSNVEGENVTMRDEESIALNGETIIRIDDNIFAYNEELREQVITALFNQLDGFEYYPFECGMKSLLYTDSLDKISLEDVKTDTYVTTYILNQDIYVPKTLSGKIATPTITNQEQKYQYTTKTKQSQSRTEILVDKVNKEIQLVASEMVRVYDEIESQGRITIEEAKGTPAWEVRITGQKDYTSGAVELTKTYTIVVTPERYPYITTETEETLLTEDSEEIIYSAKKYSIQCSELLIKDGISDTITIGEDRKVVLTKRIGIRNGETYILDEEIVTDLGTLTVELYEDENHIYLEQDGVLDTETLLYIKYILRNDFTSNYVTSQEVISAINLSPEEIKIQSHKLALEGYTTINDGFSVDLEGNMTCNDATINGTMYDKDGNILVWGDGVYSHLEFVSSCTNNGYIMPGYAFSNIGYFTNTSTVYLSYLVIEANIPSNFTITEAYITVTHQPIEYAGSTSEAGTPISLNGIVGASSNISIFANYSEYGDGIYYFEMGTELQDDREITGDNTYALEYTEHTTQGDKHHDTRTFSDSETQTVVSKDLSDYLRAGETTVFKIGSMTTADEIQEYGSSIDDYIKEMYRRTGRAKATLTVYGYLKTKMEVENE